jgi:undecaprenyl diphosphate synthase
VDPTERFPMAPASQLDWGATPLPKHVGIVPDGNRRYARKVGMSTADAYFIAARKALEAVGWCLEAGIANLSAFGVSKENIALRPYDEMRWLHEALVFFCEEVLRMSDVRLHLFGDAAGLPAFVPGRERLLEIQRQDRDEARDLTVHVGVNYSGGGEIVALMSAVRANGLEPVERSPVAFLSSAGVPAVDLVVRTGGQRRLSGFLPFQTAYAELWFTDTLWPELGRDEFLRALAWYSTQERRFGE